MSDKYLVNVKTKEHRPVDLMEWAVGFENRTAIDAGPEWRAHVHVANTEQGGVRVSTVFLGLDHGFGANGPPILYESMTFGGPNDGDCERYATWEEAERGHAAMVAKSIGVIQ